MNANEILKQVDMEVGTRPESFADFLSALRDAAYATAEHLESNWQEKVSAKAWMKIGNAVDRALGVYNSERPF